MTMVVRVLYIICVILCVFSLGNGEEVKVNVQGMTSIAETDDNFICATLDWWPVDKCDYGQCPWGKAGLLNLDLKNTILANAIKAFKSLRLRLGGSLQDQITYDVIRGFEECEPFKHDNNAMFKFRGGCLGMDRWDELYSFFNQNGALITFGLNALKGKQKAKTNDNLWEGVWNGTNAAQLINYCVVKKYNIDSWELGNELCGGGVGARIEAEQYGKDMIALKQIVKDAYGGLPSTPKVLGPAGFYDKAWFDTFLQASGPGVVDGVTHHIYNLGAGDDPKLIGRIQDPYYLSTDMAQTFKDISSSVNKFGPWSGAWVGEAGGAYNSGGKDVSHTFVDGFWYLDQLGMTSTFNHKVYCRQAFIGGNYALLNTTTFVPNPDYYGALLWHRLMGKTVLSASHSSSPYLRVYAHCSKNTPGIAVLIINMSNSTTFEVSVINDMNLYPSRKLLWSDDREEYHLTPKDGNIQSDELLLNGTPVKLTKSLDIPALNPQLVDPTLPISVGPDSIVFATLKGFKAPACKLP